MATHKQTGLKVAVKVVNKSAVKQKPEMLQNEVAILSQVEHPNIIALYDIFETPDRSEEHTSELQSLMRISYAVFCLKKHNTHNTTLIQKNHRLYTRTQPKRRTE